MKSRSIGSIYAELTLKDASFQKKLASAGKAAAEFGKKTARVGTAALGAGLVASTAALAAGTRHTLDMVDSLGDMSAQTGVAVSDLMKLQRAYQDGGREASQAGADIARMQKALVTAAGGGGDPFASLGLSAAKLISMNPADQFARIGEAIMRISNPAERTAKAMEIFGKGGRGLLTVFEGLPAAERALGRMPELAQKFAGAMGEANDLIGHLPLKSDQFFMGFTAGIIGELLPTLQKIDEYDFTQLGERLGLTIAAAFEGLTSGTIFEIGALKFEAAFAEAAGNVANILAEVYKSTTPVGQAYSLATTGHLADPRKILEKAHNAKNPLGDLSGAMDEAAAVLWNDLEKRVARNLDELSAKTATDGKSAARISPALGGLPLGADLVAPGPASNLDFVNDYQKRGLSLSGGITGGTETKMEQQHQTIQRMETLLRQVVDKFAPGTW